MADTVPMRQYEAGDGFVKFKARPDHRHLNPAGGVHGGVYATILDSVMGNAVHTKLEAGVGYATVDLTVKMLAPMSVDQDLFGEGRVIHIGKRTAVADGRITDQGGKLLAHGTCTCVIFRP
jgi:uncharacterized protein (TIGR00369 family)